MICMFHSSNCHHCRRLNHLILQQNPEQLASLGPYYFLSSGLTAWNDMPAYLRNSDLTLSDFRQLLKTALFWTVSDRSPMVCIITTSTPDPD